MRLIRELELHSVSSVFAALAPDGREDAGSKMALSSLLQMMWADEFVDERDARFINDRVHANIQRDGTFSVVPQMKGGVTSSAQLRSIADVADKYEVPMIKLTGGQRIDLLGLRKEDLPAVWADLDMPSGLRLRQELPHRENLRRHRLLPLRGRATPPRWASPSRSGTRASPGPAKMKLAVTGCPRNCAEALCKDLGVVAVEGGRWEIYVGGAAGAHIRKGDLLATVDSPEEVIAVDRAVPAVLPGERQLARTHLRLGAAHSASTRSGPSSSTTARASPTDLDRPCRSPSTPIVTPGRTAASPSTPGQFRTSLPLTVRCRRCRSDDRDVGLGSVDEIPVGEGRAFAVDGTQVAVFRLRDGSLRARRRASPTPRRPAGRRPRRRAGGGLPAARLHIRPDDRAGGRQRRGGGAGLFGARRRLRPYSLDCRRGSIQLEPVAAAKKSSPTTPAHQPTAARIYSGHC